MNKQITQALVLTASLLLMLMAGTTGVWAQHYSFSYMPYSQDFENASTYSNGWTGNAEKEQINYAGSNVIHVYNNWGSGNRNANLNLSSLFSSAFTSYVFEFDFNESYPTDNNYKNTTTIVTTDGTLFSIEANNNTTTIYNSSNISIGSFTNAGWSNTTTAPGSSLYHFLITSNSSGTTLKVTQGESTIMAETTLHSGLAIIQSINNSLGRYYSHVMYDNIIFHTYYTPQNWVDGNTFTVPDYMGELTSNTVTADGISMEIGVASETQVVRGDNYALSVIDVNGYTHKQWGVVPPTMGTFYKFIPTANRTLSVTGYFDGSGNATLYDVTSSSVLGSITNTSGQFSQSFSLTAGHTYYLYGEDGTTLCLKSFSYQGANFTNNYACVSIGENYTQAVNNMLNPEYTVVDKVGELASASVSVSNTGVVSGLTAGGTAKIQATNGLETAVYYLTVAYEATAYPGHLWDFYTVEKGLTTTDDLKNVPNPADATIKTGLNGYSWKAEYKNANNNERPEWYLQDAVRGDNAFIVPETAGLIFVNNARNFFLRNDADTYSHIGIRGNYGGTSFTIPLLKKGDIVEILWRHESAGSGSSFEATNLKDLRGKVINEEFEITESAYRRIRNYVGPYSFVVAADGDVTFTLKDYGNNDIQSIRIYSGEYLPTMRNVKLEGNVAAPNTLLLDNQEDGYTYTYCNQLYSTATGPAMYVLKGYQSGRDDIKCVQGADAADEYNYQTHTDENAYPISQEESDRLYEMRKNLIGFKMYNTPWLRGANYPTYNYGHIDATSGWGKVTIRMNNYTADMKYLIGYTPDFTLNIGSAPHQEYPYTWDFTKISAQTVKGNADNVYNTIRQGNSNDAYYDEYNTNWTEGEDDVFTLNTDNTAQFASQYVPGAVLVTTNRALSNFNGAAEGIYAKDELDGIGVNGQISIHGDATRNAVSRTRAATEELLSFEVEDYVSLDVSETLHVTTGTNMAAGAGLIQFGADKVEFHSGITMNGSSADLYGYKCDGDIVADKKSSKYIQLTPSRPFKAGDVISLDVFATSTPTGSDYGISFYGENVAGATAIRTIYISNGIAKNTVETLAYTITTNDGIEGLSSIYVFRASGNSTYVVSGSVYGEPASSSSSIITEMYCQTPTTLTIPDLNADSKQDWIYVSASQAPLKVVNGQDTETYLDDENNQQTRTVDHLLVPVTSGTDGPDANTTNHVYKYKVANPGNAYITFDAETKIYKIGVTHILKEIHPVGGVGWATEIRKHSIDHALTGYFTKNDVNAYTVKYDSYDLNTATVALTPIQEDGYVPDRTGIVMKLNDSSNLSQANNGKYVPLFYPSYTLPPSSTAVDFPANNMMYNVEEGIDQDNRNYNEILNGYSKFILTNVHWTFKEGVALSEEEPEGKKITETDAAGFYRMHIWKTTSEGDIAAKNTMPAHSAYMLVPVEKMPLAVWDMTNSQARRNTIGIRMLSDDITGIDDVEMRSERAADNSGQEDTIGGDIWYTVSGMKLSGRPSKAGLYIHNNRKVVIR